MAATELAPAPKIPPLQIYPDRPGINVEPYLAILNRPPDTQLTTNDRDRVLALEHQLTTSLDLNHDLVDVTGRSGVKGVEPLWEKTVNMSSFYPEYFLTPKGREDLAKNLNIDPSTPLETFRDVERALYGYDYSPIKTKTLEGLSGRSKRYVEARMVSQYASSGYTDVSAVVDPQAMTVIRNPRVLAEKFCGLKDLKVFLREYRPDQQTIDGDQSGYQAALAAVVDMHRTRVNELIAGLYPIIESLKKQHRAAPTLATMSALAELTRGLSLQSAARFIAKERPLSQFARIDRFENGVGELEEGTEHRNYSVLSAPAIALAESNSDPSSNKTGKPYLFEELFKKIGPEALAKIRIKAPTYQAWMMLFLDSIGQLSSESPDGYDSDRPGPAADGKWQSVIVYDKDSLSINGQKKVQETPDSLDRDIDGISPPVGGVPALDHEGAHVEQQINKEEMGLAIGKKVCMDRRGPLAEGGAIYWETLCQEEFFGQVRGGNPHYLRAVQARLRGGSLRDCMKAFFDSVMRQNPKANKEKSAKLAVDRAGRLFRGGGRYADRSGYLTNSEPLVYIEQELIVALLRALGQTEWLFFGGINFRTLGELYQKNVLVFKNKIEPAKRPSQVVENQIREFLAAA